MHYLIASINTFYQSFILYILYILRGTFLYILYLTFYTSYTFYYIQAVAFMQSYPFRLMFAMHYF